MRAVLVCEHMCVCEIVCGREREGEREKESKKDDDDDDEAATLFRPLTV